jgi:Ca-activated chloride channel family protein
VEGYKQMRRSISFGLLLVTLVFLAVPLQAQSGRARTNQTTKPTSSASQTSTDSSANDLDPGPAATNGTAEEIEGDTVRIDTSLVVVPVSVMDHYGKYVPNLRRQDFHIFDEGVEQRIAYFATVDKPFTVVLVIDTSGSTHFRLDEIQNAAIGFVNQLKADDRVMVMSFDDQIKVLTEPTNDREALIHAIRRTRTGGGTRLYDAVETVIKQKLSQILGRKAIVLFTDGVDTTSRHATYSSTLREAQESDGAVYTVNYDTGSFNPFDPNHTQIPFPGGGGGIGIGLPFPGSGRGGGSTGSSPEDYRRAREYLHQLAEQSGGRYYRGDTVSDVASAFSEVADELRRQYSIGYYPTPVGQPGQRRQIKVRMTHPDLVVKARDSYIYAQKNASDKTSKGQLPETTAPAKHLTGSP